MNSSLMGEAEAASSTTTTATTLVQGDGTFNADKLDKFIKQVKLGKCGVSYVVVAIMGPQSSGKSTLLNHLFKTEFKEMDAEQGRCQTTKGVWIAKCVGIEPCTIVMDVEGSDGSEREDDTAFEKQSALFVLAVSDIVMINMWCHDIGREQAANRPLLKTVFEVMLRLLITPRKTTLMFVIRDKTKTPFEKLESGLRNDIQKIWDSLTKPEAHKETPLSKFFNVQVVALASYETNEQQFKEQVASLRQKFFNSTAPGGLAGDRRGAVDGSGFSISAKRMWERIKENKELDLPSHKVMVATVRCKEISREKYSSFLANEEWLQLEKAVKSHPVPGFGKLLSSLLCKSLSSYDEETTYYEDGVKSAQRKKLKKKLLQLIQPAYNLMLGHLRSTTLAKFKEAVSDVLKEGQGVEVAVQNCIPKFTRLFDKQCEDIVIKQADWPDTTRTRKELLRDFDLHIAKAKRSKLNELSKEAAKKNKVLEAGLSAAKVLGWLGGSLVSKSLVMAEEAGEVGIAALGGATVGFACALACYAAYKAYKAMKDNDIKIETGLQNILGGLKDNDIEIGTELQTILHGLKNNDIEIETELQTILRSLKDNDIDIDSEWKTIQSGLKDNDTELQTIIRGLKDNNIGIENELQTILRRLKDNCKFEEEEKGDEDEDEDDDDDDDEDEDDDDDEDEDEKR